MIYNVYQEPLLKIVRSPIVHIPLKIKTLSVDECAGGGGDAHDGGGARVCGDGSVELLRQKGWQLGQGRQV